MPIRRALLALAVAIGLAACSSATTATPDVRDTRTDVPFTGCDVVACAGTIDGARYQILLPATWNGTLLIYSHGYRAAQPVPPDFKPIDTRPEPAPGWASKQGDVAEQLLAKGYALAGSSFASNGWAVSDGVKAAGGLHAFFTSSIGQPSRVYVWGDSLGGLITQEVAERHPEWVDGAAPFCGVLAGVVPNSELGIDVTFAVRELIDPALRVTGYPTYEAAVKGVSSAAQKVVDAAKDVDGGGTAEVLFISALVDGPAQTKTFDGATVESRVKAAVESIVTALGYAVLAGYDMEQRFGGAIAGNEGTDYSARISPEERAAIDTVTAGATDDLLAELSNGKRTSALPAAQEAALASGGDPKGLVLVPTITLHTAADPLVIVQNESFFKERYLARQKDGTAKADLVQLFTTAPAKYTEKAGAPYGAGHCNFSADVRVSVIELLDTWVRTGVTPTRPVIEAALPPRTTGYNALYQPGPWPVTR